MKHFQSPAPRHPVTRIFPRSTQCVGLCHAEVIAAKNKAMIKKYENIMEMKLISTSARSPKYLHTIHDVSLELFGGDTLALMYTSGAQLLHFGKSNVSRT